MNSFEKRISLSDVVPNRMVYPVCSTTGSVAATEEPFVFISPSYPSRITDSLFAATSKGNAISMRDHNVKGVDCNGFEQYNFHALFLSESDAKAYAYDINNDNLTKEMTVLRDKLVAQKQAQREEEDDNW